MNGKDIQGEHHTMAAQYTLTVKLKEPRTCRYKNSKYPLLRVNIETTMTTSIVVVNHIIGCYKPCLICDGVKAVRDSVHLEDCNIRYLEVLLQISEHRKMSLACPQLLLVE